MTKDEICEVCGKNKEDLGLFCGLACCQECHARIRNSNGTVLEGKYIIYQKEIKL